MAEELNRCQTSLLVRLDSAKEPWDKAETALRTLETAGRVVTDREASRPRQVWEAQVRQILKSAGESLNAAVACAQLYEETESVQAIINGLRNIYMAEKEAFNAEMRMYGHKLAQ